MKKLLITAAIAANLVGCASVNMADPQREAAVKNFAAPSKQAAVYVYRNESMGASIKMDVEVDGRSIGQTAANTFLYKELTPGKHTITSKAENTDSIEIDAKPGTLYYVWQEVKMGLLTARTKLNRVDEAQGKRGVRETKLAQTN